MASQNVTDPRLGPRILDLMAQGLSAQQAVETVTAEAPHIAYRQILAIGRGWAASDLLRAEFAGNLE